MSVSIWYNVLNQFIIQRILGSRSIWDARMAVVFAGYVKLLLPLITVLPGLILFALHPEYLARRLARLRSTRPIRATSFS